jgi:hypothetical protein
MANDENGRKGPDPELIRSLGGEVEFGPGQSVVAIQMRGPLASDVAMSVVAGFPDVRTLDISGTRVTDGGLEHLARMDQLEVLIIKNTRITDAGIAKLQKALPDLQIIR